MSKILSDVIGKPCRVVMMGIYDMQVTIMEVDDDWIKLQDKKGKVKIIKKRFVSSIILQAT